MKKHTITALVSNRSGVLTRISGLFARRGFNIDSLCVCATEDEKLSRMTIVLNGDDYTLAQMTKQMDKLIDVKKIAVAGEDGSIFRELLLIKVSAPAEKRSELIEIKGRRSSTSPPKASSSNLRASRTSLTALSRWWSRTASSRWRARA